MVRNNNNLAWKNLTVVDLIADRSAAMVMVGNPSKSTKKYVLEFYKEKNEGGKAIFEGSRSKALKWMKKYIMHGN